MPGRSRASKHKRQQAQAAREAETAPCEPESRSWLPAFVIGSPGRLRISLLAALVISGMLGTWYLARGQSVPATQRAEVDARRAYGYMRKVCELGPRPSGSRAMAEQQKLIADHFTGLGAAVRYQAFDAPHPLSGAPVRMNNIIVTWHPEAKRRVLLACHYDTRPLPDRDPVNPRGRFIGANDGGSGAALLMELAHHLPNIKAAYGVDFVFFDGEELIYVDRGKFFLGSEHFAIEYRRRAPEHKYVAGVLVDMIGDRDLQLYQERHSARLAPAVTRSVWAAAKRLGVREFVPELRHEVEDDHIPLNKIAGIPTCDIIDFDYPYWHTTQDIPENCSGESLAKVGRVLLEWLERPGVEFK
jgi:hypothetical protein